MCVGTNVIYRKQTIVDIAGIAEVSDSEDAFTTLKLMEHGYKVFFLDEQLAVGLSPTSLLAFYNQQYRWARGGFAMMLKHNTLFNKRLHIEQKIQFFFSNFFYLSGISMVVYLTSPLVVILFNVRPINDGYFQEWVLSYALFFCTNFLFVLVLGKKHRLQSMLLGMFSFVPYLNAFFSVFLGVRFRWKPTNAKSKGTITRLLTSYIIYLAVSLVTIYLLLTGVLPFDLGSIQYYFWLGVDVILIASFIVNSYIAASYVTVPVFETMKVPTTPLGNDDLLGELRSKVNLCLSQTTELAHILHAEQKITSVDITASHSIEDSPTPQLPATKKKKGHLRKVTLVSTPLAPKQVRNDRRRVCKPIHITLLSTPSASRQGLLSRFSRTRMGWKSNAEVKLESLSSRLSPSYKTLSAKNNSEHSREKIALYKG
jgi:hypothetical protein